VVLVTFDTTRYDHFGCTGDPEAHTPTVDGLAGHGTLFEHAYASVPLTLPSHTTIMTGLEPVARGVHENGRFRVPDALETLAERLRAAGWQTGAFVSAFVLDRRFGLDRGFDTYSDETHRPGGALEGMHDRYAAAIASADAALGRLLDGIAALGRGRGTLVVFTADHGESLEEHGARTQGILAYDSTLHVPIVLAGPGVPAGVRADTLARHIDVVPTVLALLGLPTPGDLPGRDLLRARADDGAVGYFECRGPNLDYGWAVIEGVRTLQWKYTARPEPAELYDVLADPRETSNRADAEPPVRAEMVDRLAAFHLRHATATTARHRVCATVTRPACAA